MLAPYVEAGDLRSPFDRRASADEPFYEHCLETRKEESRWIAVLDLDEFLFSPTKTTVRDILAEFEDAPGVVVNWAVFGPSEHGTRQEGLVIENYMRRTDDPAFNHMVKSIVDPRRVESAPGPHFFTYMDGELAVDGRRQSRRASERHGFGLALPPAYQPLRDQVAGGVRGQASDAQRAHPHAESPDPQLREALSQAQRDALRGDSFYLEDLRRALAADPRPGTRSEVA